MTKVAVTNPIKTKLAVLDTTEAVSFSSGFIVTISKEAAVVGGLAMHRPKVEFVSKSCKIASKSC